MDLARTCFWISLVIIALVYGIFAERYKLFPSDQIYSAEHALRQVVEERAMLAGTKPTLHTNKSRYTGSGLITNTRPGELFGLTLVASFFDDSLGIQLMDENGQTVNHWPVKVL